MSDPDHINIPTATRAELQAYLEHRGFAVYETEDTEDLREAAQLDMETRPTSEFPTLPTEDRRR